MISPRSPAAGMRFERESTQMDLKLRSPSRNSPFPPTPSPTNGFGTSSPSRISPRSSFVDRSPSPSRNPTDADEILDFVRHHQQRNQNGLTLEREPTMTWDEKRKPLLPGIPKSPRDEGKSGEQPNDNFLKPGHHSVSKSLENIPGRMEDQNRLLKPKIPVARVRSLPPIEVHMERPSAPDPSGREHSPQDDSWEDRWSDTSSPPDSNQNSPRR